LSDTPELDVDEELGRRAFWLMLLATAASFVSWNLVLPVLPIIVLGTGVAPPLAGSVTVATMIATIAVELAYPTILARIGAYPLLLSGMLGALASQLILALLAPLPVMLLAGVIFGVSLAAVATTTSTAIGALYPAGKGARAFGIYGAAATLPGIFAAPAGLLILPVAGGRGVFLTAAVSSAISVLVVILLRLPRLPHQESASPVAVLARPGVRPVVIAFICMTFTFGGVMSFAALALRADHFASPAVFFLTLGLVRSVGRVLSGRVLGRPRAQMAPAFVLGAAGLVCLATGVPAFIVAAAVLYGTAFAMVQNAAFMEMLVRSSRAGAAGVSAVWNFSMDAGNGLAALILAPIGAAIGYSHMFIFLPLVLALGLSTWALAEGTSNPRSASFRR
jgi:predicted MFS family arabinose efflux permease